MRDDAPTELRSTRAPPRFAEARFTPGAVVAGRYRIVSLLGGGGMGEVVAAGFGPLTLSPRDWLFARSMFVLVALAALAVWAFRASLAGKPLLGRLALEDEAAA